MYEFIRTLANLDRRIIYLVMVTVLSLPFFFAYSLPIYPETYTQQFYKTIEQIAADPDQKNKVVLVLHNWGPGTSGENEPQFKVVTRHLLRKNLKIVLLCSIVDPVFHDTALVAFEEAMAEEQALARTRGEPVPQWEYGVDWLDFGFQNAQVFAPFARKIIMTPRDFYQRDYRFNRDLTVDDSFPLLQHFQSIEDVSAVVVISAGDEARDIAGLVKSERPELLVAPATTGIVATDLYPYVKSRQLFGMLNSARGATEYRALLDPDLATTEPLENALSGGKTLLLAFVLLGNVAFLITRHAQRTRKLPPRPPGTRDPLPPLPKHFMWGLFLAFVAVFFGTAAYEFYRFQHDQSLPRARIARPTDDPTKEYASYERVDRTEVGDEALARLDEQGIPPNMRRPDLAADRAFKNMIENRVAEFFMAFCTLGVFAFLLGDNKFYRLTEAIIVGGALAYSLIAVQRIVFEQWGGWIIEGFTEPGDRVKLLWILLVIPGTLWYFTYSRKYRWLNQWVVALFLGWALGPEFSKQINLIIPQVLDSIQPIWPWTPYTVEAGGETLTFVDPWARIEHLIFLIVLVLSLIYFIFVFRPKSSVGNGVLTAGRLVMMVGFGASFGNTVNTRLSWLAPRIGFLIEDWLGKTFGV